MKMKKEITKPEYEASREMSRRNNDKRVEKRLQVIILRYEGKKDREIAEKLDYHRKRVSQLCNEFKEVGLEAYASRKYGGKRRNLRADEEKEFLAGFEEAAKNGQIITVAEIAAANVNSDLILYKKSV